MGRRRGFFFQFTTKNISVVKMNEECLLHPRDAPEEGAMA
jgi:hypothetical protein